MRDHRELLGLERDIERRPLLEDVTRRRPPLRLVRETEPLPWWDSPAFGAAAAASLLAGAVLIAVGMGWIR